MAAVALMLLFTGMMFPGSIAIAQSDGTVPAEAFDKSAVSEFWREIRRGEVGRVSIPNAQAGQLIQSEGDNWRVWRNGTVSRWGGWGLFGIVALLALFFLARGQIKVERGLSGQTVERFKPIERFSHWLLAVSFIILALTGLNTLYGRYALKPVIGADAFGAITFAGKWLHNYVAFGFMIALVLVLALWLVHNFPSRHDIVWLLKGGGMFSRSHPPAKKFNAGQKIVFWLVILAGVSVSLSGIALLFPFQTALFAKTFAFLNLFGANLPSDLSPLAEMQLAQLWHTIVALFLIVVIIAHIYIGTIGMEGAFEAMSTGQVDLNWAEEHHSLWVDELREKGVIEQRRREAAAASEASDGEHPSGSHGPRPAPAE